MKLATDGNLVLMDQQGNEVWSTRLATPDPRMQIAFTDKGVLYLRRSSGEVAWSIEDLAMPSALAAGALRNGAPAMTAEDSAILERHNKLRAQHGVPPLRWSAILAAEAQQWANTCGPMQHAPFNTRNAGENLSAFSTEQMPARVQSWYDEVNVYNFNNPGFNKGGSSQTTQTGHFTQLLWRATEELGCAKAMCPRSAYPGWLVCRYWPGGNFADMDSGGEAAAFARNVPRPVK